MPLHDVDVGAITMKLTISVYLLYEVNKHIFSEIVDASTKILDFSEEKKKTRSFKWHKKN